jgi:two-component system nitrate/nitrite response regulator NarL
LCQSERQSLAPPDQGTTFVGPEDATAPQLSPRELVVLRCLTGGHSNKFIALKSDITEATVKVHVKAILRKIGVQNRTQAAIWGMNHPPWGGIRNANDVSPLPITDLDEPL